MHCDSHFIIGKSHLVCEDYAISDFKSSGKPFVVLSDGCSSADSTNIGSMVISSLAKSCIKTWELLEEIPETKLSKSEDRHFDRIVYQTMKGAKKVAIDLGVNDDCLNATLLVAEVFDEETIVLMIGDGLVVLRCKDGRIIIQRLEYFDNAPCYPIYLIDKEKMDLYHKNFSGKPKLSNLTINPDGGKSFVEEEYKQNNVGFFVVSNKEVKSVTIFSDGITSSETVDFIDAAIELTNFKNYTGGFVKRRLRRYAKDCQKNGIEFADDISMATIYFGE